MIAMKNKPIIIFTLLYSISMGQEISAKEIMERVHSIKRPSASIMEIRLDITRVKRKKEKTKVREFIRYEKYYDSGKYRSKSLARFIKPKIVKGTGLLSWINRNGQTEQWFFLPKLKTAKKVKAKEKSRSFLNTDFIYEDLESRKPGLDSLASIGTEFINGDQCKVLMAWPKSESAYFSRKIWVNIRNWQICKVEYYKSESEKQKTLTLTDFIEDNGFTTAAKMVMDRGDGNKTVMQVMSFKPNVGLNDEIFSRSFLIKI